jgi:hypothetical protein
MASVSLQRGDSEQATDAKEREKPRGHMRILQDGQRITPASDHTFISSRAAHQQQKSLIVVIWTKQEPQLAKENFDSNTFERIRNGNFVY